ncbi:MAG: Type 1 glutamine amidotransferase-like domain-containing protein [Gammaproteobacteria bacterium]|nr:Type 1 glutamine amidotransferase-like domain-containing protein [Gammaproteobacteria bacterium]
MIYIYSHDVPELDKLLLETLGPKHRFTMIPPSPKEMGEALHAMEVFREAGLHARTQSTRFYRDPVRLYNIIMNSDAVYLSGGNTFEFLKYAQGVGLFDMLADFEEGGGIIVAESAGSIILSPNIATALIPTSSPDEESVRLERFTGMGRIPFHISPHHDSSSKQENDELQALAHYSKIPVIALHDGEGLIIEGDEVTRIVGNPSKYYPDIVPAVNLEPGVVMPKWAGEIPDQ